MRRVVLVVIFLFLVGFGVIWSMGNHNTNNIDRNNTTNFRKLINCGSTLGVDRQICDFLNFSSKFTSELIEKKLLSASGTSSITKLGLENSSRVEGLLIDFFEKDNYILMLMGFDSKDGGRLVAPVKIPIYSISDSTNDIFFFVRESEQQNTFSHRVDIKLKNKNDINTYLEALRGNVIVLMFMDDMVSNESIQKISNSTTASRLAKDINDHGVFANRVLLNSVFSNNISVRYKNSNVNLASIKKKSDINTLSSENMPIVLSIIVFPGNK